MKLSINTSTLRRRFGDEEAIKMIKAAGFECYDYSLYDIEERDDLLGEDYKERAQRLRKLADEIGIECNQAHAPFEFKYDDVLDESNKAYLRIVRSIEAAAIHGAENIIIHSITRLPEGVDFTKYNRKFYLSFIPYCKRFRIKVSVENLFNCDDGMYAGFLSKPQEHIDFVSLLNSDCFNACVDVGHSTLTGCKPEDVIAAMDKNMLCALHIHDNYGISDIHNIPTFGIHNWDKITEALRSIGYKGVFTFEIDLNRYENEILKEVLLFTEKIGRYLVRKFN